MPIENPPLELRALIDGVGDAIDQAGPAMSAGIMKALRTVTAQSTWLPPDRRRANHENYARHILWCDPRGRFSVLSIVWVLGQRSPVHGHHTWCAVGVYDGTLTESSYREPRDGGPAVETASEERGAGSVSFDAGAGVHRIANRSAAPAISIHIYGVGVERVNGGINRVIAP